MRLLKRTDAGDFSLTTEFTGNALIPPYAMLSHTWGKTEDEVTFKDLEMAAGRSNIGYEKIQFCGDQAARDGLEYFWVDTCCINKSSDAELSEAINSMFRWYRESAKCYVYIPDVSMSENISTGKRIRLDAGEQFVSTRWFMRGWTLQELLAPATVEFFSTEGSYIGNKVTLDQTISQITGINILAIQGRNLSEFSIEERLGWAKLRQTKKPEDKAYSLLGILDISMPVTYGEGEEKAFNRLREESSRPQRCKRCRRTCARYLLIRFFRAIFSRLPQASGAAYDSRANEDDPRCHPKTRISLLRDIDNWINNPSGKCILWLKGMAGTAQVHHLAYRCRIPCTPRIAGGEFLL